MKKTKIGNKEIFPPTSFRAQKENRNSITYNTEFYLYVHMLMEYANRVST